MDSQRKRITAAVLCLTMLLSGCGSFSEFRSKVNKTAEIVANVTAAEENTEPATEASPEPSAVPVQENSAEASDASEENEAAVTEETGTEEASNLQPVQLVDYLIDPAMFEPAKEQGTVLTVGYSTTNYYTKEDIVLNKQMQVYLPYGYSEDRQYDVLFLSHDTGGNSGYWFGRDHVYNTPDAGNREISIVNMMDNLIEKKLCVPMIVVSLDCYVHEGARWAHQSERDYEQFPHEFRNDILPVIRQNFSVYESREHYGFMGTSFGAYVEYICILADCYDLVGWHAMTGGGYVSEKYLKERWNAVGAQDMECNLLYFAQGEYDRQAEIAQCVEDLSAGSKFSEENLKYTVIRSGNHDDRCSDNCLYNTMQLFFR